MSVKTENVTNEPEKVVDDISSVEADKLAALRAKLNKGNNMPAKIVEEKTRSLKFGVVGSGQGGNRLAASFYELGYPSVCFNTAAQDLKDIKIPEDNKYLFQHGLGGAAKSRELGREAAEAYKDAINELVSDKLSDAQVYVLCSSLGGGSGAGSVSTIIDVLSTHGKPIVMIGILPMTHEDAQAKKNSLDTLVELTKEVQNKRISNLIVVDNARVENLYQNVSQFDFYSVSNQAIVAPLDAFNTLSSQSSAVKSLDSTEFARILVDGGGLTVYGEISVPNYEDEVAVADAVISNLNNGLLASGFDLKQSKYVGVIFAAPKTVWDKIPSASINYSMSILHDICGTPNAVFRGIYVSDSKEDAVKVYSIFSGLGLPSDRIEQLKKETEKFSGQVKIKDDQRNLNLKLDSGTEQTVSAAEQIKQKIQLKKSAFGNLVNNSVQDLRKK